MAVEPGDIPLIIRPDNGEAHEIIADMRDVGAWERISPHNTLRKLAENPSTEDYYSLAHITIRRKLGMDAVSSFAEFKQSTIVVPRMDAATSAGLSRDELVGVLEKSMSHPEATPETVADVVLDLLEALRERSMDPTR